MIRAIVLLAMVACGGSSTKPVPTPKPTTPVETAKPQPPFTGKWSELTGTVKAIRVTGADGLRVEITAAVAGAKGKPLDPDQLRDALGAVMKLLGVADVTLQAVQLADGIELVVEVAMQPIVRKVSAIEAGGKAIALGMATPPTNGPLDPLKVQALAASLRDRYVGSGHFDADVTWKQVPVTNGVEIVIEVAPGPAATIASVAFKGNTVASKTLTPVVEKLLVVGQPALADKIEAASLAISQHYWNVGFANVKIRSPKPVAGPNALVFTIDEGPKFKIGKLEIKGDLPKAEHAKYLKLFGVKKGDVFSRSKIVEGRDRMAAALTATGKPNASVTPQTNVNLEKRTIDFTLEVALGQ